MSNRLNFKFKNREPFAANPVYKKDLFVGCPFEHHKAGRKKNYKGLWNLYMHFTLVHKNEPRYKDKIRELADLVIEGTLI